MRTVMDTGVKCAVHRLHSTRTRTLASPAGERPPDDSDLDDLPKFPIWYAQRRAQHPERASQREVRLRFDVLDGDVVGAGATVVVGVDRGCVVVGLTDVVVVVDGGCHRGRDAVVVEVVEDGAEVGGAARRGAVVGVVAGAAVV